MPSSASEAEAGVDFVAAVYEIANNLAVRSCEPDARSLSFGAMSSELMSLSWILVVDMDRNDCIESTESPFLSNRAPRSQILAVLSCEAVTRKLRSRFEVATAPTDST